MHLANHMPLMSLAMAHVLFQEGELFGILREL